MRTIEKSEYEKLLETSEVLEKDRHGIKVLRLPDGNFLKTFWIRHIFSSRRIYPEWLRFVLHAGALKRRRIPTVTVLETVRLPHLRRTAVVYAPLQGRTLRQEASGGGFHAATAVELGRFIAGLHGKGVYFHSLHLGNILLCPDGCFGLIDISNMRVFPWPLQGSARRRNFSHLLRCPEDRRILTEAGLSNLEHGYQEVSRLRSIRLDPEMAAQQK